MERMRDGRGFTLIELLMVIAIVGIIAAMVVHGLLRARIASNEASAISSLRLVNTSQSAFVSTCGGGFFAPSFSVLATPPAGTGEGFISIDLSNDPATKSSYLIAVTPGVVAAVSPTSCNGAASGTLVRTYYVAADPLPGGGTRYFGMNQGGTIYWSQVVIPVTQNGAPAGTQPIQQGN